MTLSRQNIVMAGGYNLAPGATSTVLAAGMTATDAPPRRELEKGALLIAGKNMRDPVFSRTVILLTDYSDDGAAGLVLNKRTTLAASQALPELEGLGADLSIYIGGPVALRHMRLLIKDDADHGIGDQIIDNIYLINTVESLQQLDFARLPGNNIRLFMGYAGWAPGQLETELLRGDWYLWPATGEILFDTNPDNIWPKLIDLAMARWI